MNLLTDSVGDVIKTSGCECAPDKQEHDYGNSQLGECAHPLLRGRQPSG